MSDNWNISGKVVLLTGATDGIGLQAARKLARLGARLILHGRNAEKGQRVLDEITAESGQANHALMLADLGSLAEVRRMADEIGRSTAALHVLINNAGVIEPERRLSQDGFEATFAVNYLAPFLLTNLLLDLLVHSAPARIVNVTSTAYLGAQGLDLDDLQMERGYDGRQAYARSKLAMILFNTVLAERLAGTGVTANCLHPGVIDTKMLRTSYPDSRGAPPEQGGDNVVWLATNPELGEVNGGFFREQRQSRLAGAAQDAVTARRLWELSEELVGLKR